MKLLTKIIIILLFLQACGSTDTPPVELPELSVQGLNIVEGNTESIVFVDVRLSKTSDEDVQFHLYTMDETAMAGQDFIGIDEQVTIESGSLRHSQKIIILGDEEFEQNESFKIILESPSGAELAVSEAKVILENDDDEIITIPTEGYMTPEKYPGMILIWQDEFDSEIKSENWTFEIGNGNSGWGNNELQFYRKENARILEGNLVIEAKEENFAGFDYTSSRMITQNKFDFKYGRVDIRAVLPGGQGIWPALWMLGSSHATVGWPQCGEVDFTEIVGGGGRDNTLHGTAHWHDGVGHTFEGGKVDLPAGTLQNKFNVFSIIWDDKSIRWLHNDSQFFELDITLDNRDEFMEKFFFIFNVAVGGNWPGFPDETTTFPQRMLIDYVRVFQPE